MSIGIQKSSPCPLYVEQLATTDETRVEMGKVTQSWKTTATEKMGSTTDLQEKDRFSRSTIVNEVFFQRTLRIANFTRLLTVLICYDSTLTIRGFVVVRSIKIPFNGSEATFLYLNYLSSNPQYQGQGVGSCLISAVFAKCFREKYQGIYVKPLPTAQSFFTRFGFVPFNHPQYQRNSLLYTASP